LFAHIIVKSGSIYVNDRRSILHIIRHISPAEMFRFCLIICDNYPGGLHVAAPPWSCTYSILVQCKMSRNMLGMISALCCLYIVS